MGSLTTTFTRKLAEYYNDEKTADVTIACGGKEWHVHTLVLALHSDVFAKMFHGGFKEANERKVTLHDDDPACLGRMIEFFYMFEYTGYEVLVDNVRMCILADKYDVTALKEFTITKFEWALGNETHLDNIAGAVTAAYEASEATREMRDIVIQMCVKYKLMSAHKESPLRELIKTIPEFAIDYVAALEAYKHRLFRYHEDQRSFTCPACIQSDWLYYRPNCQREIVTCTTCRNKIYLDTPAMGSPDPRRLSGVNSAMNSSDAGY